MARGIGEQLTLKITWPRPEGEVALWADLCLARGLKVLEGRPKRTYDLERTQDRLRFEQWTPSTDVPGCPEPALKLSCASDADWDLDLLVVPTGRLQWRKDFSRFLTAIEKDRLQALQDLVDRPMLRAARRVGQQLGLEHADVDVLCVMALLRFDEALQQSLPDSGTRFDPVVAKLLPTLLKIKPRELQRRIGPNSALHRMRLVQSARFQVSDLETAPLRPLLEALTNIENIDRDPLAYFLAPAMPSQLTVDDYSHLPVGIELLADVLRNAYATRRTGVNLLLHGAPGTGKTQLSRLLAQQVNAAAFEVPLVDEDGDARNGNSRVESLQLCQQALRQHQHPLMIFDEAEDLFPSPVFAWFFQSKDALHKGWINRMLETNPVPTIWIANQVDHLDPAFLRRFDLVVEVPAPPRAVRHRLLDSMLPPDAISTRWRAELVELEDLAPDEIERVARTGTHLQNRDCAEREKVLRQVFEQARKVTGRKSSPDHQPLPGHYRPEFINADLDLAAVADQLVITRSGRLCLYGAPGSGKSAYAQHLSERVGMPLLVRRASDLIDKYIGETEKNLAKAFQRAKDEGAVLLIDEADSFLQDRQRAERSWEISHVNELLTQMERFEGVLVMCTNLFDQLDAATLRRFDIKVKLNYLRTDQRTALFDDCVIRYGIAAPAQQHEQAAARLSRLDRLTPGDFQTVLRRRRLVGAGDALSFVEALAAEQAGKRDGESRTIGFV